MSAEKKSIIYRFPNATVVDWARYPKGGFDLLIDGESVAVISSLPTPTLVEALRYRNISIFEPVSENARLIKSTLSQETVSYVPRDSTLDLRHISTEEFEELSPGFKKLYERELSEPTETREPIEHELINLAVDFEEEVLFGKKHLTDLHARVDAIRKAEARRSSFGYSTHSDPKVELWRTLPLELNSSELIRIVGQLGDKLLSGSGYGARVSLADYYREPAELTISFFGEHYDGKMRKVLEQKKNGGHYADRRGHWVRDLPKVVGQAKVSLGDLDSWWSSIGGNELSDSDKLEALTELTRIFWRL